MPSKTTDQTTKMIDCRECGQKTPLSRIDTSFCSSKCSVAFTNRRRTRGAELYDLMMINRHERKIAKAQRVWFLITRLCMYWREQDMREREGRKSWADPKKVLQRTAWAKSTVVDR